MNTITRHNYEEYFLLYVDDELNNQQRQEVENFVQQNADLARELQMLQQTKFPAEKNIVFADKNVLMKKTEPEINLNNYEEYFLLFIDHELNFSEKQSVEKFLLQYPQLNNEFSLLQQTVLPKEKIEFTDKFVLLKTEKADKKIISVNWMKLAAAAVFTGLIAFGWFKMSSNKITNVVVSKPAQTVNANKNNNIISPQKPEIENKSDKSSVAVLPLSNKSTKKINATASTKNKNQLINKIKETIAANNLSNNTIKNQSEITKQKDESLQPQQILAATDAQKNNQINFSSLHPLQEIDEEKTKTENADYAAETRAQLAQQANYKELNTSDDDSKTLYVGTMQLNENKVNNLLKKASRIFGGKARDITNDDAKLQVANLEINSKKL